MKKRKEESERERKERKTDLETGEKKRGNTKQRKRRTNLERIRNVFQAKTET